jgi:hypothetical protein
VTREQTITAAQELVDGPNDLDAIVLRFAAGEVTVTPTPAPTIGVTDLRGTWNATTGKVDLRYTFDASANPYVVLKDGAVVNDSKTASGNYEDSNGDAHVAQAKGTTSAYRVRDAKGVESNEVRVSAGTVEAPPDPQTQPPPIVVTDPAIPDNAIAVTVDEFNAKQQAGKNYLVKPGEYKFTGDAGLKPKLDGMGIYAEPGKVLIRHTGTNSFARCIDVLANSGKLFGLRGAGPKGTIVIQGNSGVRDLFVMDCAGLDGECGQFFLSNGITNAVIRKCVMGRLRRYGIYGKFYGVTVFDGLEFGQSTGGDGYNQEHNIRIERFSGRLEIVNCKGAEGSQDMDKSALNVKTTTTDGKDKLIVTGGTFPNVGLGPLGDKDGLVHKSDPAYVLRGALLDGVTVTKELRLELNCLDLLARNCNIARVYGDDSGQYRSEYLAAGRKLPTATFEQGQIGDVGGVTGGFKFT